jgi:ribosomal protein S27AE
MTLEHRKKIGAANLGMTLERGRKPLSNATKSKMSETHRTVKSNLRLLELRECPHCNIVVTAGNFARWHGEKCKYQSSVQ